MSIEQALRTALDNRTDLIEQKRNLEITDANMALLKNQRMPSANLVANYGGQGIGGTRIIRDGTGGPIIGTIPGGYPDALDVMWQREYPTWTVQVQVAYPIGPNPQAAQYERAKIGLEQSLIQIRSLELQIATEVTNARLQVDANLKRVEAARVSRELSQRRLEAEQSKFDVGLSTNYFVVQAQRDLLDAENSLLARGARLPAVARRSSSGRSSRRVGPAWPSASRAAAPPLAPGAEPTPPRARRAPAGTPAFLASEVSDAQVDRRDRPRPGGGTRVLHARRRWQRRGRQGRRAWCRASRAALRGRSRSRR